MSSKSPTVSELRELHSRVKDDPSSLKDMDIKTIEKVKSFVCKPLKVGVEIYSPEPEIWIMCIEEIERRKAELEKALFGKKISIKRDFFS